MSLLRRCRWFEMWFIGVQSHIGVEADQQAVCRNCAFADLVYGCLGISRYQTLHPDRPLIRGPIRSQSRPASH